MTVQWTEDALDDVQELYAWIAEDDKNAARRMARLVRDAGYALENFPERGRRHELVEDVRVWPVAKTPYIIEYMVHEDEVVILSVIHARNRSLGFVPQD